MRSSIALLVLFSLLGFAANRSYDGYKVYKFVARTDLQNAYLDSLVESPDFDFWTEINKVGKPISVMVSPEAQGRFERYLNVNEIPYIIEIENVESTIQNEREYHQRRNALSKGRISFEQYLRHSEINEYLSNLATTYPDIVTLENIGQSYEKRDMVLIKISTGTSNPAKPVILVDAGIHAREWIAPAMALYLINQLLENPDNTNLIENVDWIVLPVVNPDGYEYSWTTERLWRKTRSPGVQCDGCDGNRNFDFHWMEVGASSWECSETYAGTSAFSEAETGNLGDFILRTPNIKAYITLHSYGQYLLYPWGWTSSLPDNWRELDDLAQKMNAAIGSINGTRYTIGSSNNALYGVSGSSRDWIMGVAGVNISYTVELPGGGVYGFDLPASRIAGVVFETFEAFKVITDYVGNL